ncbi:MAG: hypothetical protein QXZ07_00510 [Nitrososphaerales archaeon]
MIKSSIEDIGIDQTEKILRVSDRVKTPSIGSLYTGIKEPLETLEKMRKNCTKLW